MTTEEVQRRLAVILSADVKEYARLMEDDEGLTIRTLASYREHLIHSIRERNGSVIDAVGDNLLALFPSVGDAVQCAIAVQRDFKIKNAALPEHRQMQFRIGIHLGDVVEQEGRIYGDGINVAARVQACAKGGGVCMSQAAFDQAEGRLPFGHTYSGKKQFKNITKAVELYRVWIEPENSEDVLERRRTRIKRLAGLVGTGFLLAAVIFIALERYAPPSGSSSPGKIAASASARQDSPSPPSTVAMGASVVTVPSSPASPGKKEPAPGPIGKHVSERKMAHPLPDKPSIVVLPFVNRSNDPHQDYFSDGLTEDIITALAKIERLFVIASHTSFTFKRRQVRLRQAAEDLGVRYILEGSVQKTGIRIRINVKLIDALQGHPLWAERYDRELKDIFLLQDEITMKVLMALHVKLVEGEQALIRARGTTHLEAYEKFLQATEQHYLFTKASGLRARQLCEEAIALDPGYSSAYALLSVVYLAEVRHRWTPSPAEAMGKALEMAQKALSLDPRSLIAQLAMGQHHMLKKEYDEAIFWGERAVAAYPHADNAHVFLAWFLMIGGRPEEAVPLLKQAILRNPIPPGWYYVVLGNTYRTLGRYEEAISALKKSVAYSQDELLAHVILAAAYGESNRLEEARGEASEVLRIQPSFSVENQARVTPYRNREHMDRFIEGLKRAGLQ